MEKYIIYFHTYFEILYCFVYYTQKHSPGLVGSPLSGLGRASTGSTAREI